MRALLALLLAVPAGAATVSKLAPAAPSLGAPSRPILAANAFSPAAAPAAALAAGPSFTLPPALFKPLELGLPESGFRPGGASAISQLYGLDRELSAEPPADASASVSPEAWTRRPAAPRPSGPSPRQAGFAFNFEGNVVGKHFPAKGSLLERAKRASSLPKHEWQGPSFPMLVRALSDPELAPQVSVLFDASHPKAEMEALFALWREQGLIANLPGGGLESAEDAAAKAELHMDRLDRLQKAEFGADAAEILAPDGDARAVLHSQGLSEDSRSDFHALRAALSTAAKKDPRRWDKLKIALFYTGGDGQDEPQGLVLRSDGKWREITVDERGEAFRRRVPQDARPGRERTPLPTPVEVRSPLATIGDAIETMKVSHRWGNKDPRVSQGEDLIATTRQDIVDFMLDRSIPNERKHVILTRYSVDDGMLATTLVEALKKGIKLTLITDFNVSMDYKLGKDEGMISDFSRATPAKSAAGRFIKTLLDGGFKIVGKGAKGDPRGSIYSQPLYNRGDSTIDPIMHEKSLLLVELPAKKDGAPKARRYRFGSANLSRNPRYNREFVLAEPLSVAFAYAHARALMDVFREGKPISAIDSAPPLRVYAEDDSYVEQAYTNGKYNPWDRAVELFERAARGEIKIDGDVIASQFVLTNGAVVNALKTAMRAQEGFDFGGVLDNKFVPADGWGRAANMAGFNTAPERGRGSLAWPAALLKRVKALSFLKGVEGRLELDADTAPTAREVWHDKTMLIPVVENGKRWAYLFTGSFNASNHVESAELQFVFRLPADSPWVKAAIDSVVEVAKRERASTLELDKDVIRSAMSSLGGLSPLYLGGSRLEDMLQALRGTFDASGYMGMLRRMVDEGVRSITDSLSGAGRNDSMLKTARDFVSKKRREGGEDAELAARGADGMNASKLVESVARIIRDGAAERLQTLEDFLKWYGDQSFAAEARMNARRIVALALLISRPGMHPQTAKQQLNQLLWTPKVSDAQLESRMRAAWKQLPMKSQYPEGDDGSDYRGPKW